MTPDVVKYLTQLELPPSASWDDVQKAYRDLIRVWHPDRFPTDEKLRSRAEQKAKDLNEAIRYLRRHYRKTMLIRRDPLQSNDPKTSVHAGGKYAFGGTHQRVRPEPDLTSAAATGASSYSRHRSFGVRRAEAFSVVKVAATNLIAFCGMCLGIAALSSIGIPDFHFASAASTSSSAPPFSGRRIDGGRLIAPAAAGADADLRLSPDDVDRFAAARSAPPRPPLIRAAMRCDTGALKRLLEARGTDVNSTDENGDSALSWTARLNCISGVRLLLDSGIETRTTANNGFTPLRWAEWARNTEIAELIKAGGAGQATTLARPVRERVARPASH